MELKDFGQLIYDFSINPDKARPYSAKALAGVKMILITVILHIDQELSRRATLAERTRTSLRIVQ